MTVLEVFLKTLRTSIEVKIKELAIGKGKVLYKKILQEEGISFHRL